MSRPRSNWIFPALAALLLTWLGLTVGEAAPVTGDTTVAEAILGVADITQPAQIELPGAAGMPGMSVGATPGTNLPVHTVVSGDTLWALAQRYCGNGNQWRSIYRANAQQIRNPDLIYPGQRFLIACQDSGYSPEAFYPTARSQYPLSEYTPQGGQPWGQTYGGRTMIERAGGRGSPYITHRPLPREAYRISSRFGPRRRPRTAGGYGSSDHKGIDLAAETGTPVGAVGPGRIKRAGWNGGYGNFIEIEHPDGTLTRYGHLSSIDPKILRPSSDADRQVQAGQIIGRVGSTGNSSGPHLHFEIRSPDLVAQNPEQFLNLA